MSTCPWTGSIFLMGKARRKLTNQHEPMINEVRKKRPYTKAGINNVKFCNTCKTRFLVVYFRHATDRNSSSLCDKESMGEIKQAFSSLFIIDTSLSSRSTFSFPCSKFDVSLRWGIPHGLSQGTTELLNWTEQGTTGNYFSWQGCAE